MSEMHIPELPFDVLTIICNRVVQNTDVSPKAVASTVRDLTSMCCAARVFQDTLFHNNVQHWKELLDVLVCCNSKRDIDEATRLVQSGLINAKRALQLVALTGCELCGHKRIRKVYWPFRMRCCTQCLYSRTINQYYLIKEYNLTTSDLKHLPFTTSQMFHPKTGTFECVFNLRSDVCNVLSKKYGKCFDTLAAAYEHVNADRLAIERHKENVRCANQQRRDALVKDVMTAAAELLMPQFNVYFTEKEVQQALTTDAKYGVEKAMTRRKTLPSNMREVVARDAALDATQALNCLLVARELPKWLAASKLPDGYIAKLHDAYVLSVSLHAVKAIKPSLFPIDEDVFVEKCWPKICTSVCAYIDKDKKLDCQFCQRKGLHGIKALDAHMRAKHH